MKNKMLNIILAGIILLGVVSCKKEEIKPNNSYNYNGVLDTNDSTDNKFYTTSWELIYYKDISTTQPLERHDTLLFHSEEIYSYNGMDNRYTFTKTNGAYNLTLYGTPFGDLSGQISINSIEYGEIINKEFTDIAIGGNSQKYFIWMKKY